jgi:hypothetical protein
LWAIGIWPNVIDTAEWPEIEALLRPAADLAGAEIETGEGWLVWTIHRDGRLVGAANVALKSDDAAEVVLVGGSGFREWIGPLDDLIGCWALEEGCTELRAFGRKGWTPILTKHGWEARAGDRVTEYRRGLV